LGYVLETQSYLGFVLETQSDLDVKEFASNQKTI
jgi:hypothetical protein